MTTAAPFTIAEDTATNATGRQSPGIQQFQAEYTEDNATATDHSCGARHCPSTNFVAEADTPNIVQEYLHAVKRPLLADRLTRQSSTPTSDDESSSEVPSLQDSWTTIFSEDQRPPDTFRSTVRFTEMQTTTASAVFHRRESAHHFTAPLRTSSTHHLLRDLNHERKLPICLNNATQTAGANAVKTQRVSTSIDLTEKYADRLDAAKILCSASI